MDRTEELNFILNILCDLKNYPDQHINTLNDIIQLVKYKLEH